jgi:hypothetical protein
MGYFTSKDEEIDYISKWCNRCIHNAKHDCPIIDAHITYGRDMLRAEVRVVLHMLIPLSTAGINKKCRLFIEDTELARARRADAQYQLWREDHQKERM